MSPMSATRSSATLVALLLMLASLSMLQVTEAKFVRRVRYDDGAFDGGYGGPYGGYGAGTGERAIMTIRGARNPYDGSAPSKLLIEDNPYRGPYPRGVYDRLDGPRGMRPYNDFGGYNNNYNSGYGPMFGAPSRIAVTGAFPYGYGSRFGK